MSKFVILLLLSTHLQLMLFAGRVQLATALCSLLFPFISIVSWMAQKSALKKATYSDTPATPHFTTKPIHNRWHSLVGTAWTKPQKLSLFSADQLQPSIFRWQLHINWVKAQEHNVIYSLELPTGTLPGSPISLGVASPNAKYIFLTCHRK